MKMALDKYFKPIKSALPNPSGPLSAKIPPASIAQANVEVKHSLEEASKEPHTKRGHYSVYSNEEKLKVSKRASEMGVTNTMRHFNALEEFKQRPLKESTIRTWMRAYRLELASTKESIKKFPSKSSLPSW